MTIATGADEKTLTQAILEHTNPGDMIDLKIGLEWWVEEAELRKVGDYLVENGLDVRMVEMRTRPWPNTMRIVFRRPSISGYGLAPIFIIGGVLAVLGMAGFIGWSLDRFFTAVAQNIVPLAAIGVAGGLAYLYMQRAAPRRT